MPPSLDVLVLLAVKSQQPCQGTVVWLTIRSVGFRCSIGSVYRSLARLGKYGRLRSRLMEPTKVRGGRAKRLYHVSARGNAALDRITLSLHRLCIKAGVQWVEYD